MRRIIFIAIMLAATVAGCNRFPDLTIQVTANLAPDATDCTIDPNQEAVLLRGTYDLAAPAFDYIVTPRIESYLFDNSLDTQAPQTNFQVTGFDVTVKLPDGSVPEFSEDLPNPYFVTSNAVIPPSDAPGDVSAGAALARVIPSSYRDAIVNAVSGADFNSIVLDLRATGRTSGGFRQTSPPFSWPIDFCFGCLGQDDCLDPPFEVGDPVGCFAGQDGWQYCSGTVPADTAP